MGLLDHFYAVQKWQLAPRRGGGLLALNLDSVAQPTIRQWTQWDLPIQKKGVNKIFKLKERGPNKILN